MEKYTKSPQVEKNNLPPVTPVESTNEAATLPEVQPTPVSPVNPDAPKLNAEGKPDLGDLQINYSVPVGDKGRRAIATLSRMPKIQTMVPVLNDKDGEFLEGNYQSLAFVVPRGKLISIPSAIAEVVNEHVQSLYLMRSKERAAK